MSCRVTCTYYPDKANVRVTLGGGFEQQDTATQREALEWLIAALQAELRGKMAEEEARDGANRPIF